MPRAKKTFKNKNGLGTVIKLSGNRRLPFAAIITLGTVYAPETKSGYKQVRKYLGYFESKEKAQVELLKYFNDSDNYNQIKNNETITFGDVYKEWKNLKYKEVSNKTIKGYEFCKNKCVDLMDIPIRKIKAAQFQNIIDSGNKSFAAKEKIKSFLNGVCNFAVEMDIIDKNYAAYCKLGKEPVSTMHIPFTEEEIEILWENISVPYVDTILIMIYTGYRINELLEMENTKNINIKEKYFIGGFKTETGRNRIVPMHNRIVPLVKARYNPKEIYFIRNKRDNSRMLYQNYRNNYWDKIMIKLHMNHLPHDCRHTFATRLNNDNANQTSIKKLIGHKSFELTEKIYTHKTVDQLRFTINTLK